MAFNTQNLIKIVKVQDGMRPHRDECDLQLLFANGRGFSTTIKNTDSHHIVASKLRDLANRIDTDKVLNEA